MYGNAPQIEKPVNPRIARLGSSLFMQSLFFFISLSTNGSINKKTTNHRQNANEIGGIKPRAPLPIAILLVIKIG